MRIITTLPYKVIVKTKCDKTWEVHRTVPGT